MHYKDLTCYRENLGSNHCLIYPQLVNIGWLDRGVPFKRGTVREEIVQKLKKIITMEANKTKDKSIKKPVNFHWGFVRSIFPCPFCPLDIAEISICNKNTKKRFMLGVNQVFIPSRIKKRFFNFPTLIYHYVVEHGYVPPVVFQESVLDFNLKGKWDGERALGHLISNKILLQEADTFNVYPEKQGF